MPRRRTFFDNIAVTHDTFKVAFTIPRCPVRSILRMGFISREGCTRLCDPEELPLSGAASVVSDFQNYRVKRPKHKKAPGDGDEPAVEWNIRQPR